MTLRDKHFLQTGEEIFFPLFRDLLWKFYSVNHSQLYISIITYK